MSASSNDAALRTATLVFGLIFVFGLFPMMMMWPSGFGWDPPQPEYEQMILGLYAVLGIYMIRASKDPARHQSLISFAAWSSVVHGLIMLVQALRDSVEIPNLYGDVPALLLVGVVLIALQRRAGHGAFSA